MNAERSTVPSPYAQYHDWNEINWMEIEQYVLKLQQRIYHEECQNAKRKVRDLQRTIMRSKAALLLSIRKVTQINKGKRTAGVDGYKALSPKDRLDLFHKMSNFHIGSHNPPAVRRTYIHKKNGKLRPLGIPTIMDRVYQNIAKLALEPQCEAKFEHTSFGFRPKRSCHDAIRTIHHKMAKGKKEWVFEGDFKGCFDNLNHDWIMKQIGNFPYSDIIQKWLTAGFVDNDVFNESESGTPQGGIISPLLANIALHGMEEEIGVTYKQRYSKRDGYTYDTSSSYTLVRYADDFVVMCETEEDAKSMYDKLKPYLTKRSLELAPDKTKISHITEGFDFLGFNVRRYEVTTNEKGYKLLVKPSKESIQKLKNKISDKRKVLNGTNVQSFISHINPMIIGTAYYWNKSVAQDVFENIDYFLWEQQRKFIRRLHPNKNWKWLIKRYYKPDKTGQSKDKWLLTDPITGHQLKRMSWFPVVKQDLLKFKASPFDINLKEYYEKRDIKDFNANNILSRQKLAKKQKFKCLLCDSSILTEEGLETHHQKPKCQGGDDTYKNLSLVHISCHIDFHRVFPAKGPIPTDKMFGAYKESLKKKRKAGIIKKTFL